MYSNQASKRHSRQQDSCTHKHILFLWGGFLFGFIVFLCVALCKVTNFCISPFLRLNSFKHFFKKKEKYYCHAVGLLAFLYSSLKKQLRQSVHVSLEILKITKYCSYSVFSKVKKIILVLLLGSFITHAHAELQSHTFSLSVDTKEHDHIRINNIDTIIHSEHFIPLKDSETAINGKSWIKVEWDKDKITDESLIINDFTSQAFEDYYFIKNNEVIAHYSSGYTDRFDVRPIKHFKFVAEISDADYMLVKTCCNPGVPIYFRLLNKQELTEDYYHDLIRYFLVYGVILFFVVYNGFISLYLREKQYFYYCYYLISMLLILLTLSGIGKQFLWPNFKYTEFLYFFASINVSLASISFIRSFLNQEYLTKNNNRLINWLIVLHILVLFSYSAIPYVDSMKLISNIMVQLVCMSAWLVTDYVIIRNIIKGDRTAWVLLFSYSLINVAGLVFVFRYNGLMPDIPWTEFFVDVAVLIEGLILSLALAQKIQKLRIEKLAVEKKQHEVQKQFSRQLITFQENERKQISRDLHDNFTHQLLLIRNQLQTSLGNTAEETLHTNKVLNEIRDLSHLIHPYLIDELGIKDAITKMVDNLMEKTELDINFVCDTIKLSQFKSLLLYRIVQEVLTYLINHTDAEECVLAISETASQHIEVLIKTDAEDISTQKNTCFSMQAIGERVQMLSGNYQITSDDVGSILKVTFDNTEEA